MYPDQQATVLLSNTIIEIRGKPDVHLGISQSDKVIVALTQTFVTCVRKKRQAIVDPIVSTILITLIRTICPTNCKQIIIIKKTI